MMVTTVAKCKPTSAAANDGSKWSQFRHQQHISLAKSLAIAIILSLCLVPLYHCLPTNKPLIFTVTNSSREVLSRNRRFLSDLEKPVIDYNHLPMTHIGVVDLSEYPECDEWFSKFRHKCQGDYERYLQSEISRRYDKHRLAYEKRRRMAQAEGQPVKPMKPFSYDRQEEYIKHASCCGIWRARSCVIEAIERERNHYLEKGCPRDLIHRIRQLPSDRKTREEVLDYCSEYSEGSLICRHSSASGIRRAGSLCLGWALCIVGAALASTIFLPRLFTH